MNKEPVTKEIKETVTEDKEDCLIGDIDLTKKISINGHNKLVTHLKFDKKYQRLITGSIDNSITFWDIQNMKSDLKPIRTLTPFDTQIIRAFDFNYNDEKVLVCASGCKPKLLTRDGKELIEFIKGDMYIRDLLYTKGHIGGTTDCKFSENDENICYTSGQDGTVRIWDINSPPFGIQKQLTNKTIIKCKRRNGQRAEVNKFLVSNVNKMIVAFCQDNAIRVYTEKNYYSRPQIELVSSKLAEVTHAEFLSDPKLIITREMDDTVKVFDLRNFKRPLHTFPNLLNSCYYTGFAISPEKNILLTGTSASKTDDSELVSIDLKTNKELNRKVMSENHITYINWAHKQSNLYIGNGSLIDIYYGNNNKGIERCLKKQPAKEKLEDQIDTRPIYVPNALPMYRPDTSQRRKRFDKMRQDDVLTKKPTVMLTGPGFGGMHSGPRTMIQNVMKTIHETKGKRVDPVERLLKFDKFTKENPQFVEPAYQFTQPKKILDHTKEEPKEQQLMSMFKKCKHCGMKMCQCVDYTKKY